MAKRSNNIISLYEEIIVQILKHLPSKSLLRFRCVSKDWRRIIDDPYFVNCHRDCSHTQPNGIQLLSVTDRAFRSCVLSDPTGTSQTRSEISLPDNEAFVFCSDRRASNAEALICFGDRVWNPSTRETMYIPRAMNCSNTMPVCRDNLLGFDAFTNKYKVLCLCFLNCRAHKVYSKIQVLTLGENSWKEIPFIPEELREDFKIFSSISFSNMIFCLVRYGIKQRFGVLTFDVQREHVGFISLPRKFQKTDLLIHLAEIEGRLAIQAGVELALWILNHVTVEWTKLEINFAGSPFNSWYGYVTDGHDSILANLITIGTIDTNEILFQCDVVREDSTGERLLKYVYYDPKTNNIRFVPKLEKTVGGMWDYMMIKHVDSVIRLNRV